MVNVIYNGNYTMDYDFEKQDDIIFRVKNYDIFYGKFSERKYPLLHSIIDYIQYNPEKFKKYVIINRIKQHIHNSNHYLLDITEFDDFDKNELEQQFKLYEPLLTNNPVLYKFKEKPELWKISPKSLVYVK